MRLELTRVGLLVELAKHYTTRGALKFTKLFAYMWHKAIWNGHPMRLELTRVGLQVELANHYTTRGALLNLRGGRAVPYSTYADDQYFA